MGQSQLQDYRFGQIFRRTFWTVDGFLDVSHRRSQFAAIRFAIRSQRFKIARFELQGQKRFELLLRHFYFYT